MSTQAPDAPEEGLDTGSLGGTWSQGFPVYSVYYWETTQGTTSHTCKCVQPMTQQEHAHNRQPREGQDPLHPTGPGSRVLSSLELWQAWLRGQLWSHAAHSWDQCPATGAGRQLVGPANSPPTDSKSDNTPKIRRQRPREGARASS
jgi:hypothetical protein